MATATSLMDWIMSLLRDPNQQAAFQADPQGYAADNGFQNLSATDVHDALCLAADNQSASYDYRGGGGENSVHYPPPSHPGASGESGARYLNNYISNNYTTVDERSTNIDNSVNERINTGGGDFSQNIHNDPVVASGDGSVAAGGDIHDSTLTTGDRNVVGQGNNAVTGNDNTTAFGSGAATNANLSNAGFGDGAAASIGGNAEGQYTSNDTTTSVQGGDGATSVNAAGAGGSADQFADQSQTDSSTHSTYDDNSSTDSHNLANSDNTAQIDDSHNTAIHPT